MTVFWASSRPANMYGPVPVGWAVAYVGYWKVSPEALTLSALYFFSAAGLCIANDGSASAAGIRPVALVSEIFAVVGSTAVQDL